MKSDHSVKSNNNPEAQVERAMRRLENFRSDARSTVENMQAQEDNDFASLSYSDWHSQINAVLETMAEDYQNDEPEVYAIILAEIPSLNDDLAEERLQEFLDYGC
jgi:acyl-coenzyme A synthetase/AMP-(fatty) acid ligase